MQVQWQVIGVSVNSDRLGERRIDPLLVFPRGGCQCFCATEGEEEGRREEKSGRGIEEVKMTGPSVWLLYGLWWSTRRVTESHALHRRYVVHRAVIVRLESCQS